MRLRLTAYISFSINLATQTAYLVQVATTYDLVAPLSPLLLSLYSHSSLLSPSLLPLSLLSLSSLLLFSLSLVLLSTGWLVVPSETEDPEANTLHIWEKQLKELMRKQ